LFYVLGALAAFLLFLETLCTNSKSDKLIDMA
jgi:hypothetical protein